MTQKSSVISLALALAASACSSDFEQCGDAGRCPGPSVAGAGAGGEGAMGATGEGGDGDQPGGGSSAQGGDGGQGGAEDEPVPCTTDEDCDDGEHCNGIESCLGNICQPGAEPCPNGDPAHCAVTCAEGAGEAVCGLEGRDADGDGHHDAECASNPGDDCDDSESGGASIHPGAGETCNAGQDDDCDGEDEATDEVVLSGSAATLVSPNSTSRRDRPSIAAMPGGGFGVVWADWRSSASPHVYYRSLAADGSAGNELLLTANPSFFNNDYPDLVAHAGEFLVAYRTQQTSDNLAVMRGMEVKFDGSASENPAIGNASTWAETGPRLTLGGATFQQLASGEVIRCSGITGCYGLGASEPLADTFHASPLSERLVYDREGDLYLKVPSENVVQVTEDVSETRTNPVITEDGTTTVLAYRYDAGIRVGSCELPDGIPIDLAQTAAGTVLLYRSPDQSKLQVRVVTSDCSSRASAVVADQEGGTTIGSASLAVDENDALAVVWSSVTSEDEWSIMQHILSPQLCE